MVNHCLFQKPELGPEMRPRNPQVPASWADRWGPRGLSRSGSPVPSTPGAAAEILGASRSHMYGCTLRYTHLHTHTCLLWAWSQTWAAGTTDTRASYPCHFGASTAPR